MLQTPVKTPVCGKVELSKPPLEMGIMSEVRMTGMDLSTGADETGAVVFLIL